ncbi:hypothetical protein SELMODRAFT_426369 [Selaginella moellendorffii]|uniref:F-box domain-containing protein n=1 Tax=Selaginella moellendorffii TaxID=88036 RepID=D8SW58_SELML|nr:hypothetical protein SELMODRAFT_426369 [Selaginella moellendorffii]
MGARRKTTTTLPQELVEEILLKLPYSSLIIARSVCKAWKAAADSSSVKSRYRDSGHFFADANSITDSSDKRMRWAPRGDYPDVLCAVSSEDQRCVLARSTQQRKLFLGNPFLNVWQEIPYKIFGDWSRACILRNKIVVWCADGMLFTWTQGDEGWSNIESPVAEDSESDSETEFVLKPVVNGNKLFCLDSLRYPNLLEFDTTSNSFSYTENVLPNGGDNYLAGAWKSKLYVGTVIDSERKANDGVWFLGQSGKYLNFCGEDCDLTKTETTYFSYDMDAGTWDKQMHRAASTAVNIVLH